MKINFQMARRVFAAVALVPALVLFVACGPDPVGPDPGGEDGPSTGGDDNKQDQ